VLDFSWLQRQLFSPR